MCLHRLQQCIHIILKLHLLQRQVLYLRAIRRTFHCIGSGEIGIRCLYQNRFRRIYREINNLVVYPQTVKFRRHRTYLLEVERAIPFQFYRIQRNNTFQCRGFQIKHLAVGTRHFTLYFEFRFGITCTQCYCSKCHKKDFLHIVSSVLFCKRACKYTSFQVQSKHFPSFFHIENCKKQLNTNFLSHSHHFT